MNYRNSLPTIFWQHRWSAFIAFASVLGTAVAYLLITPPVYKSEARLMVQNKQSSVSDLGRNLNSGEITPGASLLANQVELVRSKQVLQDALKQLSTPEHRNLPKIESLKRNLKVTIVPATSILELSYRDRDPELSAALLNEITKSLIKTNIYTIQSEARSARTFLEVEVAKRRAALVKAEADETNYRRVSGIASLPDQTKTLVEQLGSLTRDVQTMVSQVQEMRTRSDFLRQLTGQPSAGSAYLNSEVDQDTELQRLRTNLSDLNNQLVTARSRFTEEHPEIKTLLEKQAAIRKQFEARLADVLPVGLSDRQVSMIASSAIRQDLSRQLITSETERQATEKRLASLRLEQAKYQAQLNALPDKALTLAALSRERQGAEDSLNFLQRKLEEARLAEAQLISNITIIDPAEAPTNVSWPSKPVVLVLAIAGGAILAVGVVLLKEMLDGTLRNATEAEKLVNLPVLGVLPILPKVALKLNQPNLFLNDPSLVEPYRTLLKSIEFRSVQGAQVVVVSSTLSGEGKSIVVSHLAAAAAMLGRRTLVIDADLRQPQQHELFSMDHRPGLTDVMDGSVSLAQAIQTTTLRHLTILPCGTPCAHPSQVLESPRLQSLLSEAASHFDLVLVDTPPVMSCMDAATLSHNNKLLLVVRPGKTPNDLLQQAVAQLASNEVHMIGVAVNGTTTHTEQYYRYPIQAYPALREASRSS